MKLLSEYNIKLAAEIISKDSKCDKEFENYILQRSDKFLSLILDYTLSSREPQKQVVDSLWVDYYLKNPEYIEKHIIQLMAVDNDERLSLVSFVTSLDDTDYILRIIKIIDDSTNDNALKNFYLFKMSDVFYLRNLKFISNEYDKTFVKKLSDKYLKNGKNFAERYKFILAFNIQKDWFNKEEIFNSIESEDIKSVIEVLNNINNKTQICDFLEIILTVKSNDCKQRLYSRIITCIYNKHIIINNEAIINKLLEEIKSLDLSVSNLFRVSLSFDLKKRDIADEKLLEVKNFLTKSMGYRLKNEKYFEEFLKKYFGLCSLPPIKDRIKDLLINSTLNDRTIKNIIQVFEHYLLNHENKDVTDLLGTILSISIKDDSFKKGLYSQIIECIFSSRNNLDCSPELTKKLFSEINQLNLSILNMFKFFISFNIPKNDIPVEKLDEIKNYFFSYNSILFRLSNKEECNLFFNKYYDSCSLPDINKLIIDIIDFHKIIKIIQIIEHYLLNHEIKELTDLLEIILSISIKDDSFKKGLYSQIIECIFSSRNNIDCSPELTKKLFSEINQLNLSILNMFKFFISFNIPKNDIPVEKLDEIKNYFSSYNSIPFRLYNKEECNLFFEKYYNSCSLPVINELVNDNIKVTKYKNIIIKVFNDNLLDSKIEIITSLLKIILSIEDADLKKGSYSGIISALYYRRSDINHLGKDKKYLLLENFQTFIREDPKVLILKRINIMNNKSHVYLNHYFNYIVYTPFSRITYFELQSQIAKMIISIDFKLIPYDFDFISDLIKKYSTKPPLVLNIISFIIELFLDYKGYKKDIIGLLYLCEKQPRCLSLLFFYLPFKIRYSIACKYGYFYSQMFNYNRMRIAKQTLEYWQPFADKIIQLYDQNIIPLDGIKKTRKMDFFFLHEFIKFIPNAIFDFNTFFIKLSDEIKIQLLEYRESFFSQKNIFLYLKAQFNKRETINENQIQIPLDEEETLFLECEKNNDPNNPKQKWKASSIIEKKTDEGVTS